MPLNYLGSSFGLFSLLLRVCVQLLGRDAALLWGISTKAKPCPPLAVAIVAQWLEHQLMPQRVVGLFSGQGHVPLLSLMLGRNLPLTSRNFCTWAGRGHCCGREVDIACMEMVVMVATYCTCVLVGTVSLLVVLCLASETPHCSVTGSTSESHCHPRACTGEVTLRIQRTLAVLAGGPPSCSWL